jgi:hypothetical protein
MPKIFISIAAFCDPYLEHTVTDAIAKAKKPERLVFGVVDQHPENRRQSLKELTPHSGLRYTNLHPVESRGVCWARSIAFSLYQDEPYLLQIDSHMLFEQDWDNLLIEQLEQLRLRHPKPILTTYPYGFEFEEDKAVVKIAVSDKTTLVLRPHPDTPLGAEYPTLRFRAEHVFLREPVLGSHIAGGFIFTLGRFVDEVPYDPHLYFHGEEQNLAIRAYTHGWDMFHPPKIPLYHLYKTPNTEHKNHHWHPDWEKERDFQWITLKNASDQRLADLLYHRKNLGRYGLGNARSLEDFAYLSGIDYVNKKIRSREYAESYPEA